MAFSPVAHAGAHGRVALDDLRVERKGAADRDRRRAAAVLVGGRVEERDTEQRSYRLRVSSARGKTVWDSGTVRSRESSDVAYDGPQLAAATRYDWRLDVVTNHGSATAGRPSGPACTTDADWAGSAWIGNARTP